MPTQPSKRGKLCVYPQSNPIRQPIQTILKSVVANREKCASFYLDTLQAHSHGGSGGGGESHHQGLARTHKLSDGSIYFFLSHSMIPPAPPEVSFLTARGQVMQFRYGARTDHDHVLSTDPLTVAPMKQLINVDEQHPSDIAFMPDVNNEDAGYLFVTEEYVQNRVSVYRWEPSGFLAPHGQIPQWFPLYPHAGPNMVFIDKVDNHYYLGLGNFNIGQVGVLRARCQELFPDCRKGGMNLSAFERLQPTTYPFPPSGAPSQVKLIRETTGQWHLLAFRSDPSDSPNGTDYVDVYSIEYRWSERGGPGSSSYVSRVDECPSE